MQSTENWRAVPGYEGLYEVSNQGDVRSCERTVYAGAGRSRVQRPRILALNVRRPSGYRLVHLYRDNQRVARYVHRIVLEAFVGPAPDGTEACHTDGDPSNNRIDNLRWGSHGENNRDQVRHGTHPWANRKACPLGHLLELPNLAAHSLARGERRCLACQRARHLKTQGFSARAADQKYAEIMSGRLEG